MSATLERVAATPEAWRAAATAIYRAGEALIADGKPVEVSLKEWEDDRSLKQNRFYWGVVLAEISEQASIGGQRYVADAWHEFFKRQFLGYEIKRANIAGRRRKVVTRTLRSTTGLKVRPMSEYLEQVLAYGAAELGVTFSVRDWREHKQ
ncbi:MAG: recombination protein NinB [Paucibacter sp.]|nr:recombination protein NinB [Roseateles sp.]